MLSTALDHDTTRAAIIALARSAELLKSVPPVSEAGVAAGAFEFLHSCPDGSSVVGYYRPESLHAWSDKEDYQLTVRGGRAVDCDCPDHVWRGHTCKHMDSYNSQFAPKPERMDEAKRAAIMASIAADYD